MDMKEDTLEPDRISICTWSRPLSFLCDGSTRVRLRLARSVVGVTSRALAVPLPDVYSPTPSQSDD
ncbi:hypothetical protein FRX31_011754 [Thalictrum thalictroides]|nr:hypothetical protein FRX31_011754 [Thalictrum thalictroides]